MTVTSQHLVEVECVSREPKGSAGQVGSSGAADVALVSPETRLDPDPNRARRLLLSAVLRGLFLDDPWRHAYLRNLWVGP